MSYLARISRIICDKGVGSVVKGGQTFHSTSLRQRDFLILTKKPMKEAQYRKKDGVPAEYELIYKAPMETYLFACKNITTLSSITLTALIAYNYNNLSRLVTVPSASEDIKMYGLVSSESDVFYFIAGFAAVAFAIRFFISKYPLRIYRNADKYLAVYDSQIPMKYKQLEFVRGQVAQAEPFLLNPWKRETFKIKDYTSVLLIDYFKTPSDLFQMLKDEK